MSILLRHADIPKYGHRIVILSDGHAYYEDFANPYVDLGEVVPVPKHGDLIDRKELIKNDHQHYEYMSDEFYVTVRDIECAPAIIPASEEDE